MNVILRLSLGLDRSSYTNILFNRRWSYNKRLISQWMVDNNQGPDHLVSPKALDPIHFRKLTI